MKKIRLHKLLFDLVKEQSLDYTRPEIQRNIEQYGVYINDVAVFNRLEWVIEYDSISIDHWPQRNHGSFKDIALVAETENMMVFFKPPGVVVEPGNGHSKDNFLAWLRAQFEQQETLGEAHRFGLVHRLDKDTQGLLVIAKTPESYQHIKSQFKDRTVLKRYLTVLSGHCTHTFSVKTFNTRHKDIPTRQKAFADEREAQEYDSKYRFAHSTFTPIIFSEDTNQTLAQVQIYTGRMHQIRLHAEFAGYPVSGDTKYSHPKHRIASQNGSELDVKRMNHPEWEILISKIFTPSSFMLLSNELELSDIDGTRRSFVFKDVQEIIQNSDLTDR
jgi:23S rRNA pseudouridine1911/1915/1917 synthase